jgi:hypothetical protein
MSKTETTKAMKPSRNKAAKPVKVKAAKPSKAGPDAQPVLRGGEQADAPQAAQPTKTTKPRKRSQPRKDRGPSKKDQLVEMLRRENGATIEELVAEFGWQAHTVRGAISIAAKRLGVTAERVEKGRYRIPA